VRLAYVLPVHRSPEQVSRLLRRLAAEDVRFVLHVDRRTPAADARGLYGIARELPQVEYVDPHACYWGGFGMVRAALKGIRHLLASGAPFDYAVLLSGQDYPLRSPRRIAAFLAAAEGRSFIECFPLPRPDGWGPRGGLDRTEDWHLIRRRALHLRLPRARRIPGGLRPFGGGAWWCLPREVVEHIDDVVRSNRRLVPFFEHVLHPSEVFFQTVIMNSPFAGTVANDNLRHIEWAGGPNPVVFTTGDLERLVASPKLFARKFDADVDSHILDLLDEHADRELADVPG
jgi:hypothetical protein